MAPSSRENEDPYQVLGVSENASRTEIRAQYRKLALLHHPDRQETSEQKQAANEKFAAISHAYEILGDDARRREYDYQKQAHQQESFFYPHESFHDPFDVFAQVFGQEFGNRGSSYSTFGGGSQGFSQDPFMNDPFFSGGSMFGGGSIFGGDIFSNFHRQMDKMRQAQQDMHQGGGQSNGSYYYSSSSSSSTFGGANTGESVTTTTRMINGKRQTVTERTVRKADGSVERHVETSGDDDFPEAHRLDQPQEQPRLPPANDDDESQPSPWKKMRRRLTGHRDDKK
jgi:DnaJ family protein B protein 6